MKTRLLALIILSIILTGCGGGIRLLETLKVPTDTELSLLEKSQIDSYINEYEQYDAIMLNLNEQYEHLYNYKEDKKLRMVSKLEEQYLVINPENQELGTWYFNTSSNEIIDNIYLKVTYPDGTVKSYGKEDLIAKIDEDRVDTLLFLKKYKRLRNILLKTETLGAYHVKFVIPRLSRGCIVTRGYELKNYRMIPFAEIPLRNSVPILNHDVSFIIPDLFAYRIHEYSATGEPKYKTEKVEGTDKTRITYHQENVPGLVEESFMPIGNNLINRLEISIVSLAENEKEFTWSDISEIFRSYFADINWLSKKEIIAVTDYLISNATNDQDKLKSIITYINENFRVDSPQPNLGVVLATHSGSAVDITTLTKVMLEHAGIKSNLVLANSVSNGMFDLSFPSPNQLDAPLLKVYIDGNESYIVPALSFNPINYIPPQYLDRQAMVIYDDKEKDYEFVKMPAINFVGDEIKQDNKVIINNDCSLDITELIVMNGSTATTFREMFEGSTDIEKDNIFDELVSYTDGVISFNSKNIENLEEPEKPLIITISYKIDNLITYNGNEIIMQTGGLFSPSNLILQRVSVQKRINSLFNVANQILLKNITIRFPDNWKLNEELTNKKFSNSFGFTDFKAQIKESDIIVRQTFRLNKFDKPKDEYAQLLEFTDSIRKMALPAFSFSITD